MNASTNAALDNGSVSASLAASAATGPTLTSASTLFSVHDFAMLDSYWSVLASGETHITLATFTDDAALLRVHHERQRELDPIGRVFDRAARSYAKAHMAIAAAKAFIERYNTPWYGAAAAHRLNENDGLGCGNRHTIRPRSFLADADSVEAVRNVLAFVLRSHALPTMVVVTTPSAPSPFVLEPLGHAILTLGERLARCMGNDFSALDPANPALLACLPRKAHFYWVIEGGVTLALDTWSLTQDAIAIACETDASMSDPSQAVRLPGSLHLKNRAAPHLVELAFASGPVWHPADFQRQTGLALYGTPSRGAQKAVKRLSNRSAHHLLRRSAREGGDHGVSRAQLAAHSVPVPPPSPRAAARSAAERERCRQTGELTRRERFIAGIKLYREASVVDAGRSCPALSEILFTEGARCPEPLWFACMNLAAFDPDSVEIAHALSRGHERYSAAETEAKLQRAIAARDSGLVGWIGCAEIAKHHPACGGCYYRDKNGSPLHLAGLDIWQALPTAPPVPSPVPDPASSASSSPDTPGGGR